MLTKHVAHLCIEIYYFTTMLLLNAGNFAGGTLSGYWFHRIRHDEAFAEDTPEREHKV
jgi:hypothetical protein